MEIGEVLRKSKGKRSVMIYSEALNNRKIELPEGTKLVHGDFI